MTPHEHAQPLRNVILSACDSSGELAQPACAPCLNEGRLASFETLQEQLTAAMASKSSCASLQDYFHCARQPCAAEAGIAPGGPQQNRLEQLTGMSECSLAITTFAASRTSNAAQLY